MEYNKAQEQRRQHIAALRSRRQSRLANANAARNTYLLSRRASLNRERDITQSRLDIIARCLGPQLRQGPHGPTVSSPIDLAARVPDYISLLRTTGQLPPHSAALLDAMTLRELETQEEVQELDPNDVNPYLVNQELAEMYACGLGKGVAARTGMVIMTCPPPPPAVMPVRGGLLPKNAIYGRWDVREWEVAVECARVVRDTEVRAAELE